MPLRIVFTLFLFMGVFQIYSQSYIESGNLELIAKDVPNGKYIIRIRMRNRPNVANAHSGQGFSIFRNSDKKQVLRRVAIPITNPNTNSDPKYDLMPNLRCDSTVFMPNGNITYGEANFIKEEIYEDTLTLNPNFYNDPQGYTITFTASNLGDSPSNLNVGFNNFTYNLPPVPPVVSLQAFVGLVLWTGPLTVGNTLIKNNSPQFAPFQPEYLCRGKSFSMVVGVTDPDGDELRFSLAHPYAQPMV